MAVIKAKPEKFLQFAWDLAERDMVLPQMVTRISGDNFKGAKDDTVSFKVPGLFTVARHYEWRTRNAPIVMDDISGGGEIPIKMGVHTYSATAVTDEQMTMDEIDWTAEVMQPQSEAVARDLEFSMRDAFYAMETQNELDFEIDTDPYLLAVEATRLMNGENIMGLVPTRGRYWLAGTNVAARIKASKYFREAAWVGSDQAGTAFREANIGRIGGWDVVESQQVDPNFSSFMHKSALVLATVAPVAPRGATQSSQIVKRGLAMRWLLDYDSNYARDRSVVSMFHGFSYMYDRRIGGDGSDRYQLKPWEIGETPKTFRAINVNFVGEESVLPAA